MTLKKKLWMADEEYSELGDESNLGEDDTTVLVRDPSSSKSSKKPVGQPKKATENEYELVTQTFATGVQTPAPHAKSDQNANPETTLLPPETKNNPNDFESFKCFKIFSFVSISVLIIALVVTWIIFGVFMTNNTFKKELVFPTNNTYNKKMAAIDNEMAEIQEELDMHEDAIQYLSSVDCSGNFESNSSFQSLSSPYYPGNYGPYHNCTWTVTGRPDTWLHLKFHDGFDVQCNSDGISIYTNVSNVLTPVTVNGTEIKDYCGSTPPFNMLGLKTNKVIVTFKSGPQSNRQGFRLLYRQQVDCNDSLEARTSFHSLYSPHYPSNYGPYHNCTWTLTGDSGLWLRYDEGFDVPCGTARISMYLNVSDVLTPVTDNGTEIKDYCGTTPPFHSLGVQQNEVLVVFNSGAQGNGRGFHLSYQTLNVDCGGSFQSTPSVRTVSSPHHPNNYGPYHNCTWTVTRGSEPGTQLKLQFLQDFDVRCEQGAGISIYVNISGVLTPVTADGKQVEDYCGSTPPFDFLKINYKEVLIQFKSGSRGNGGGFRLSYETSFCAQFNTGDSYLRNNPLSFTPTNLYIGDRTELVFSVEVAEDAFVALSTYPHRFYANHTYLIAIDYIEDECVFSNRFGDNYKQFSDGPCILSSSVYEDFWLRWTVTGTFLTMELGEGNVVGEKFIFSYDYPEIFDINYIAIGVEKLSERGNFRFCV